MLERSTAFRAEDHGFGFLNSFRPQVFADWLATRTEVVPDLEGGWADQLAGLAGFDSFGLCGGMCFVALDRYFARLPINEDRAVPEGDSPLLDEILRRQVANLRPGWLGFEVLATCMTWHGLPDEDGWYSAVWPSVGRLTQGTEWPRVKRKIDAGIPTTICLVMGKLSAPWRDHQVVVTGYTFDESAQRLTLSVYDPNAGRETTTIALTLGQEDSALDMAPASIRGFFHVPYDRTERVIERADSLVGPADDLGWFWLLWGAGIEQTHVSPG